MNHLTFHVSQSDLQSTNDFWEHLRRRFFSRLERPHEAGARSLENRLRRYYLITCVQNGRSDKVAEFFERHAAELQFQPEWRDWFALPFTRNPEAHPTFEAYFSREWQDNFVLSLHNFLNTVFQNLPLPSLLAFHEDQERLKAMAVELCQLQETIKEQRDIQHQHQQRGGGSGGGSGSARADAWGGVAPTMTTTTDVDAGHGHTPASPSPSSSSAAAAPHVSREASAGSAAAAAAGGLPDDTVSVNVGGGEEDEEAEDEVDEEEADSSAKQRDADADADADNNVSASPAQQVFVAINTESYTEHRAAVVQLRASRAADLVASADADGVVKVWSFAPSLATVATVDTGAAFSTLAWADKVLYIGRRDASISRFEVGTGAAEVETVAVKVEGHPVVTALACKPHIVMAAMSVAVPGGGGSSHSSAATSVLVALNPRTLEVLFQFEKLALTTSIHLNTGGTLLVLASADKLVRIADVGAKAFLGTPWTPHPEAGVRSVCFGPGDTGIFSIGCDGQVKMFGAPPQAMVAQGGEGVWADIAVSSEGEYLLQGGAKGAVIYPVRHAEDAPPAVGVCALGGHAGGVGSVEWVASDMMGGSICFTGGGAGEGVLVHTLTNLSQV